MKSEGGGRHTSTQERSQGSNLSAQANSLPQGRASFLISLQTSVQTCFSLISPGPCITWVSACHNQWVKPSNRQTQSEVRMGSLMVEVHLQPLHAAVTHLHLWISQWFDLSPKCSAKVTRYGFYALLTASCLRIGGVVLQVSIQGLIFLEAKLQLDAAG